MADGAKVMVVARDAQLLAELERRLGGSASWAMSPTWLATSLLQRISPTVLALNAGATPVMGPLHEQSWEGFNDAWNTDVKAGFHWIQAAIRLPLPQVAAC